MLTEALDAGSAALQVGYESATQFNREYSRLFGQPPRRDMEALRATAEKQLPTLDQMNRN
jgi:AraC-like DNA-binding protein